MNKIMLESKLMRVKEVVKNTSAKMFGDLVVGDVVKFSIPIEYAGIGRMTYASYIKCENVNTGEITDKSFNQLPKILRCFTWEECE